MNIPDQTFKLQTRLSTWSGTKRIADWLVIIALALCAIGVALILVGKEKRVGALALPLLLVSTSLLLRVQAKKQITEIEAELAS